MIDFPITENQIRVLSDEKLLKVLELVQQEHTRRQQEYIETARQKVRDTKLYYTHGQEITSVEEYNEVQSKQKE